jgi:CheY-like chemotaxis protein
MGVTAVSAPLGDQFVRLLAAQLGEIRGMLEAVFDEPEAAPPRDRLAEKLRSFSARAAELGLDMLVEELAACDGILQSAAVFGALDHQDGDLLSEALDRIADSVRGQLACEVTPTSASMKTLVPATGGAVEDSTPDVEPTHVLIIAPPTVVDGLVLDSDHTPDSGPPLAIEQVSDVIAAREVVRALGPDLIVLDTDLDGAMPLVEALVNDSLTDAIPIVALGHWRSPEDAAPYIALGVARHLNKPVTPGLLRRALTELSPSEATSFEPMGTSTLDEIGARLADELHRGLCDAASETSRGKRIDVGDGSEVLATLWGAVGRIRELLTVKAGGQLEFVIAGPEQAVLANPWLAGQMPSRVAKTRARRAEEGATLEGMTVMVVEEDLSMNWFLCGVLRDAGATVVDSFDGEHALTEAYRFAPDIVLCDVAMPKIDGLALCRAFKGDIDLACVPFVLLSSDEDLLQRAHELGAGADAYLRKESSAELIIKRLLELSIPQRRVTARLAQGGRVRGRLSGLSAHRVLAMVCDQRPISRFCLSDATRTFEIEIRDGRPISATVTDAAGHTLSGPPVFDALLAVGVGRFDVQDVSQAERVPVELTGTLQELVSMPRARTRAAQSLLSGSALVGVHAVHFEALEQRACLAAMPTAARELLMAIADGASPREMIVTGQVPAHQLETVLRDVARRGAIASILLRNGIDALPQAIERERALLDGTAEDGAIMEAHSGAQVSILSALPPFAAGDSGPSSIAAAIVVRAKPVIPCSVYSDAGNTAIPPAVAVQAAPVVDIVAAHDGHGDHGLPSDEGRPSDDGRLSEPLFTRTTTPAGRELRYAGPLGRANEPVIIDQRHCTPILASAGVAVSSGAQGATPMLATAMVHDLEQHHEAHLAGAQLDSRADDRQRYSDAGFTTAIDSRAEGEAFPKLPRLPRPSAYAKRAVFEEQPKGNRMARFLLPVLFGLLGVGLAIGARWMRDSAPAPAVPHQTLPAQAVPAVDSKPAAGRDGATPASNAPASDAIKVTPVELFDLTPKERAKLRKGQGLLEIVAGRGHEISVDGKVVGRGPVRKLPLAAREKSYEIRVTMRGEQRVRYAVVTADKRTRLRVAPPWSK